MGALMRASSKRGSDVTGAVRTMEKFSDNLGRAHWKAAIKILDYLANTKHLGMTYDSKHMDGVMINAYVDSDHATCTDSRRWASREAITLGGADISYVSGCQESTAVATLEAEYAAVGKALKEALFLRRVERFMVSDMRGVFGPDYGGHPSCH